LSTFKKVEKARKRFKESERDLLSGRARKMLKSFTEMLLATQQKFSKELEAMNEAEIGVYKGALREELERSREKKIKLNRSWRRKEKSVMKLNED
jgi:hypothetical protein